MEHDGAGAARLLRYQTFVGLALCFVANVDLIMRRVGINVKRLSILPNERHLSFRQRLQFLSLFSGGRDVRFKTG